MPSEIVMDTCPVPQCNLSEPDIGKFMDEMKNYIAIFAPAFQHVEQLERSGIYLRGSLGDATRKYIEKWRLNWSKTCATFNTLSAKARGRPDRRLKSINAWWRRHWAKPMEWL